MTVKRTARIGIDRVTARGTDDLHAGEGQLPPTPSARAPIGPRRRQLYGDGGLASCGSGVVGLRQGEAMEHTFEELEKKKVADLREIAEGIEHDVLHGYTTMHKDQLLKALCTALGIEGHEHHEVVGIDKQTIKLQIRELKTKRDAALEAHDSAELKRVRRKIHRLKRRVRAATV